MAILFTLNLLRKKKVKAGLISRKKSSFHLPRGPHIHIPENEGPKGVPWNSKSNPDKNKETSLRRKLDVGGWADYM